MTEQERRDGNIDLLARELQTELGVDNSIPDLIRGLAIHYGLYVDVWGPEDVQDVLDEIVPEADAQAIWDEALPDFECNDWRDYVAEVYELITIAHRNWLAKKRGVVWADDDVPYPGGYLSEED